MKNHWLKPAQKPLEADDFVISINEARRLFNLPEAKPHTPEMNRKLAEIFQDVIRMVQEC